MFRFGIRKNKYYMYGPNHDHHDVTPIIIIIIIILVVVVLIIIIIISMMRIVATISIIIRHNCTVSLPFFINNPVTVDPLIHSLLLWHSGPPSACESIGLPARTKKHELHGLFGGFNSLEKTIEIPSSQITSPSRGSESWRSPRNGYFLQIHVIGRRSTTQCRNPKPNIHIYIYRHGNGRMKKCDRSVVPQQCIANFSWNGR